MNLRKDRTAVCDLIFRVLFSLIFIVAGIGHFVEPQMMLERLQQSPWYEWLSALGSPSWMLSASGVSLLAGGLGLLAGFQIRWSALVLSATLIPITVAVHFAPGHTGPLFKNVALLGGLIHFAAHGNNGLTGDSQ